MKNDEGIYYCPLINRPIWMGDCYDINAVLEGMIKRSILTSLEKEIGLEINLKTASKVCSDCCHYNFKE